jgi:hypothetical protein
MDSLNNSLHELDVVPIEYAPKFKYFLILFRKLEGLKPSHFHLHNQVLEFGGEAGSDFQLERELVEGEEDEIVSKESTNKSDSSENQFERLDDSNTEAEEDCPQELSNLCILKFLRENSN